MSLFHWGVKQPVIKIMKEFLRRNSTFKVEFSQLTPVTKLLTLSDTQKDVTLRIIRNNQRGRRYYYEGSRNSDWLTPREAEYIYMVVWYYAIEEIQNKKDAERELVNEIYGEN
jgi:hypothetical protein